MKKARVWNNQSKYLEYLHQQYKGYLHFSFDDVQICLRNLVAHKSEFISIFDGPFLRQLNTLHEQYDAKFSLYVYLEDFMQLDDTWALEFSTASSWLKFGLHARNDTENYCTCGYDEAYNDYTMFCKKIIQVCGGVDCLDKAPRFHNFGVSLTALKGFRDAEHGICGILTADDSRNVLPLTLEEQKLLNKMGYYFHEELGMLFKRTDIRLDWYDKRHRNKYLYPKLIHGKIKQDFINMLLAHIKIDAKHPMFVFTHEWRCYSEGGEMLPMMTWVDEVCKLAVTCGMRFEYLQNSFEK